MMATKTASKLDRLKYYGTAYELAIWKGDTRYLVAYTGRKSRNGILSSVRRHGEKLVALTGIQSIDFAKKASEGASMGEWKVNFTGRTEREAIATESELPFIGTTPL